MLAQSRRSPAMARAGLAPLAVALILLTPACDKVPLLAPGGTVITIFSTSNTVPLNGEVEIVATAIENGTTAPPTTPPPTTPPTTPTTPSTPTAPTSTSSTGAGTPVQNGTVITFTTTLGRIEPADARTQNGQVRVRFISGGQSGTATITAFSGGASGKLENLRIGTAAAERVLLTATPAVLPPSGGTTEIAARVEDVTGGGLPGVPVSFTADQGSLGAGSATTDSSGVAKTTLTATRTTIVTANVAGKTATVTVNTSARTGVTITGPTTAVSAGTPVTFTVGVGAAPAVNIRDVTVDFGDGARVSLGAISASTPVQHTYAAEGSYRAAATATEASGFTETVATFVTILPQQPPSVIIQASNSNPTPGETVIFTATVSGATSTILRYEWNFGRAAFPATATTTGNRATATYESTGTSVITVRVVQASGPPGEGTTSIRVVAGTPVR
jgi:large repetitive protein